MSIEKHYRDVADHHYKDSFNLLFNEIEDYLFILDETGRIIRANKAALENLEYTLEEIMNMNVEQLHPLARRAEVVEIVKGMLEGNIPKCLIPLCNKSGKLIPAETRMVKGKWEGDDVLYGISKNVSVVKKEDERVKNIQLLLDCMPFLVWMKDKNGKYVAVNRNFEEFYSVKNTEIIGKTDFDIFSYEIALEHKNNEEVVMRTKKQQSLKRLQMRNKVGDRWFEILRLPYFENYEVVGTIGIANNITEQVQLELELAKQKRFLTTILNTIPDYIFYKDINSVLLGCNKAYAEKFIGVNEDEVIGKTDLDLIKDTELAKLCWQKDRETLVSLKMVKYEGNFVLTDGRVIEFETLKVPFWDEQGRVAGLIGVARDITARKRLEKQLREQMEYAELLFRTVPNAVLSVTKDGKIIRWNKIAEEITGYTSAEVMGQECSRVLHGVDRDDCRLCGKVIDAPLINEKCKIVTKDGQIRHILKSIAVLKDEFGEISEKMECFEDITEIIDMEADLRESKEGYAAIVNNAPQFVVIHQKGIIKFVNDAGIEALGYGDDYIGYHIKNFMTENSLERVNSALRDRMNGKPESPYEIELVKKSGEIINVLLKGTDITFESEAATLAVMMDITESKRLNAKLRASEEKFRQLAETINEVFLITDKERIVYVNPAYERISGMSCQSLLDNPLSLVKLIHPTDSKNMKASMSYGLQNMNETANEEFRIIRPDGEIRWLWLQSYPLRDEATGSLLKASSLVDITDRKRIEEKLYERERQTQMELFLAARVQQDSLPQPFVGDKVRVSSIFEPFSTVSGDFFNYKWFEEKNKLCGYIVDVSGHGMATALQTATFKMMLDNVLLSGEKIDEGALQIINQSIMDYLYEDSFAALLYFEFDLPAAVLTLISAGITLFLAAKPTECSLVPISGCYLGIIDTPDIEMETIPLKAGDIYCMMSDGASDLIELHGISKQESFIEYKNWLERLAKSPERNDDFSVVCIEILQENKEINLLNIKNDEDLEQAQLMISEFLERNKPRHASLLEVAINEAMNNGFYAGGQIHVKIRRIGGRLIVRVKDDGPGFNPKQVDAQLKVVMHEEEFDELLEAESGRGILMMRMFCDRVVYNAKGNEVLLMKRL